MTDVAADGAAGPDRQPLADALARVLASEAFGHAPKSRDVLAFVVTETLAGRADSLNERRIARLALGRPASIDTRVDASGRVQVARVRERLQRYYEGEGAADPVEITIPVGQYAASFSRRSRPRRASTSGRRARDARSPSPTVAVVALRPGGGERRERRTAIGLTESLVGQLARFPGLRVVGPLTPRPLVDGDVDVLAIGARSGADVVLFGRCREAGDLLRVGVHLADAGTGEILWTDTIDVGRAGPEPFGAEDEVVARVAAAVGDYRGVVLRAAPPGAPSDSVSARDALARYYAFFDDLDPGSGGAAKGALEEVATREPRNAHVLAALGFLYAVDVLMSGAAGAPASLTRAQEFGQRAVHLDPTSAQAHAVLAVVALARGEHTTARAHADSVLDLAPHHPSLGYVAGMVVGASGDWDEGIRVIRQLVQLDPYRPSHRRTLLAIDHLLRDDPAAALAEASQIDFPAYVYGPLLRAVAYHELGVVTAAKEELREVLKLRPEILSDAAAVLGAVPTLPPPVVAFLVDRLHAVGQAAGP